MYASRIFISNEYKQQLFVPTCQVRNSDIAESFEVNNFLAMGTLNEGRLTL